MHNFIQPGNVLGLTAPSGGVVSGLGYQIGSLFVVATDTIAEDLEFQGQISGVIDLVKTTSQAWTEGQLLYWDDGTSKVTSVAGANLLVGVASRDAGSSDATGRVRLNGTAPDSATAGNVVTADLADGSVTKAKAAVFFSAETTATGSAQNVAHGLGVAPAGVLIVPTDTSPAVAGVYTVVEGTHTSTNVVVTVTSGKKFKVFAWA